MITDITTVAKLKIRKVNHLLSPISLYKKHCKWKTIPNISIVFRKSNPVTRTLWSWTTTTKNLQFLLNTITTTSVFQYNLKDSWKKLDAKTKFLQELTWKMHTSFCTAINIHWAGHTTQVYLCTNLLYKRCATCIGLYWEHITMIRH